VIILSHRGYWKTATEKNSVAAFCRSFDLGFGTETDIRDAVGKVVISHDPPVGDEMTLAALFAVRGARPLPLALNVKADGLTAHVRAALDAAGDRGECFVFDMSVPDALGYLRAGIRAFTRHSEEEAEPPFYKQAAGVWLDAFYSDWYTPDVIARHLDRGKAVCVVSPELHKRDHRAVWDMLAGSKLVTHPRLMLCTDLPEDAADHFGGDT
jgi:glycerophosphoryl diester phosphodiesterase